MRETHTRRAFLLRHPLATRALAACILVLSVTSVAFGVVYVKKGATGAGNGTSWDDAATTIQAGIDLAAAHSGDEVWVAQGTYYEAIVMKSGVALYGGFTGTESNLSQRNWNTNVTTIDASTARGGQPAYHVVTMDSITSSTIDGFTITRGYTYGALGSDQNGGGIYCARLNDSNAVRNNRISLNGASCFQSCGGGVFCQESSPIITNNIIRNNGAGWHGGGIACCTGSAPNIMNNIISANSAGSGGGVYCGSSSPMIANNAILGNSAEEGGGIQCDDSSAAIVSNTIWQNGAHVSNDGWGEMEGGGGGICCHKSVPNVTKNVILENEVSAYATASGRPRHWQVYAYVYGGGIYCDSTSATVTNNVISRNLASASAYNAPFPQYGMATAQAYGAAMCCSASFPLVANNVVVGNRVSASSSNGAAAAFAGGIFCDSCSPEIRNSCFSNNDQCAIYEGDSISDPSVSYNDFYIDFFYFWQHIYFDYETGFYANVSLMDAAILECSNNIGADPLFVGDTLQGGSWTGNAFYNSDGLQTTLINSSASWAVNEHAGRLLNPDTSQNRQFVIVSNTATTMEVWGNATGIAHVGDTYKIFDYHLRSSSPCIDAGCMVPGLTEDFEGDPRPYDGTPLPRGDGSGYDIGADEFVPAIPHWLAWIFY